MTTTFFLVRHAAHDNVGGFLAGRTPGIHLGEAGLAQAARVGQRMARERFESIIASPRDRAQETAAAIASASGVTVETDEALEEIDFGSWSNRTFDDLNREPAWRRWNEVRSLSQTPAGETMLDVQHRVVRLINRLRQQWREQAVVLVSHADVIRVAVGYVLGLPIDLWQRFDIGPGSVTTLVIGDWGGRALTINEIVP